MKKALVTCHVGRHYKKFGHYDIEALKELGYKVDFAANFDLPIDKVEENAGIKLHQIDFSRNPFSLKNIKAYKQLKKLIDTNCYDIIHCQSPVGGVITRIAAKEARKRGTKVIYTAHGFHFYKGAPFYYWLLFYPIEKYLSKYTDTIITINLEDYEIAKKNFKNCHNIQHITGIGIDTKKFLNTTNDQEKKELKKFLGFQEKDFIMIYTARLDKNKNQLFLIKAMKKIVKKNSDIHLLLVGQDELNGKCQKKAKQYHLNKNIHFLGYRNDIPQLLKMSDVAVSASKREGMPLNIMEAVCCNKPVIALDCRGINNLIKNNVNGIIISNTKQREKKFIENIESIYHKDIYFKNIKDYNKEIIKKIDIKEIRKMVKKQLRT